MCDVHLFLMSSNWLSEKNYKDAWFLTIKRLFGYNYVRFNIFANVHLFWRLTMDYGGKAFWGC